MSRFHNATAVIVGGSKGIGFRLAEHVLAAGGPELADLDPLERPGEPGDAAAAVAFLLSSDTRWVTGQTLSVDGGPGLTVAQLPRSQEVAR